MSWGLQIVGRDKEKLKAAIREHQCKDEEKAPHNGIPKRVVDYLCAEVDRVRVYEFQDRKYGIHIDANGSFHEQGGYEKTDVRQIQLVE